MDEVIDLRDDSPDLLTYYPEYEANNAELTVKFGVGVQRIEQVDLTNDDGSESTSVNDDAVSFGSSPNALERGIEYSGGDGNDSDSFERLSLPSPSFEYLNSAGPIHSTDTVHDIVLRSSIVGDLEEPRSPTKRGKRKNQEDIETERAAKELKKREREQVASQKMAEKQKKQDEKKAEQERKKREKLLEVEIKRFEREKTSAASKAKCESYLTTVFDAGVLAIMGMLLKDKN
uniref:Uncharacterized protein n=1 Tax=Plectus sambesii TaxID=2011161 RepID=A0A914UIA7_9BILA